MENIKASQLRRLSKFDLWISRLDQRIKQLSKQPAQPPKTIRSSPARGHTEAKLSRQERNHAGGLMRVNHTGEVCAQGLYEGQALLARSKETRDKLLSAAKEEADHLAWCEVRLQELNTNPSRLNPIFFAASFGLGAITATAGDKVSLGFVHATEERVASHLRRHLKILPQQDRKSRLILQQMLADEERHGSEALSHGGEEFPKRIKNAMTLASKFMTKTAYWF